MGRPLRELLWVLAIVRRGHGLRLLELWRFSAGFRPGPVPGLPGRILGRDQLQAPRVLLLVRRQEGCDLRPGRPRAFIREEVLEEVPHAMWTLTIPMMLRRYFLNHRKLLGKLARAGFETVQELMIEAVGGDQSFPTGMVAVIQTAGDLLEWNPHVHAIAARGGWNRDGSWVPLPYIDTKAAELVFRSKVIAFLKAEGVLSEERIEMLHGWNHSAPRRAVLGAQRCYGAT